MRRSRSGSRIEPLGSVLLRAGTIKAPKHAPRTPVSERDWKAAVGTRIALRAVPVRLERGVLHVRAASATWAQELSLLAEPILKELSARGLKVSELRFRVGPVDPPERIKTRQEIRTSPPPVRLPDSLADDIQRVPDEALREAIRHAAEKNLGWQRMLRKKSATTEGRSSQGSSTTNQEVGTNQSETNPSAQPTSAATTTQRGALGPPRAARESAPQDRAEERASASPRGKRG